jgi:ADP-ribose pyrophosphatase YjhB (NUDIX family)
MLTLEAQTYLCQKPSEVFKSLKLTIPYAYDNIPFDDLYIGIAIMHRKNSRVLLLRHTIKSPTTSKDIEQYFALPSAKVEAEDTVGEALMKTVKEKTDLVLQKIINLFDTKEYYLKREFLAEDGMTWVIERKKCVQLCFKVEAVRPQVEDERHCAVLGGLEAEKGEIGVGDGVEGIGMGDDKERGGKPFQGLWVDREMMDCLEMTKEMRDVVGMAVGISLRGVERQGRMGGVGYSRPAHEQRVIE